MSGTGDRWTIGRLLEWSIGYLKNKGFKSAQLDAQLLLAHSLKTDRLKLYLNFDQPLAEAELAAYKTLLKRRLAFEPVAYILGAKAFWQAQFKVGPGVLIPRPETEHLVEAALARLARDSQARVVELGVGSGAVIISLAAERPEIQPLATDISGQALETARANAAALELDQRLEFLVGDLFEPLAGRVFDMILMNPPYVSQAEYEGLARDIRDHEPAGALLAGPEGLDVIRRLIAQAPQHLEPGGRLLLEIGSGQGAEVRRLLEAGPYSEIEILPDLARLDRVACARFEG